MTIPEKYYQVRITHRGGYWERVLEYMQEGYNDKTAWLLVEDELYNNGYPARYTSGPSFRNAKHELQEILNEWKTQRKEVIFALNQSKCAKLAPI